MSKVVSETVAGVAPSASASTRDQRKLKFLAPGEITVVDNPRKTFDDEKFQELLASVREHGVKVPLLVDGQHQLVAGERRLRAAREAGLDRVPCFVDPSLDAAAAAAMRLVENLQRDDLLPMEEALAVARMAEQFGMTEELAAQRLGKSLAWLRDRLALVRLPEVVQAAVNDRQLSVGAALTLVPWLPKRPGEEPTELLLKMAQELVRTRPSASSASNWVSDQVWRLASVLDTASEWEMDHHARYNSTPGKRVFAADQEVAGLPPCNNCPHRSSVTSHNQKRSICLQMSCYAKKQEAAWGPLAEAARAKSAEKEQQQKEAKALARTIAKALPLLDSHKVTETAETLGTLVAAAAKGDQAKCDLAARALGFSGMEELQVGLSVGKVVDLHSLTLPDVARHVTALMVRKAQGEDITTSAARNEKKAKKGSGVEIDLAAIPPVPNADPQAAAKLALIGQDFWKPATGSEPFARDSYLPLEMLLSFFRRRWEIGASQMPPQLHTVTLSIPEWGIENVQGNEYGRDGQGLALLEDRVSLVLENARMSFPLPAGPVLYRTHMTGAGFAKTMDQQLVIPFDHSGQRVHLVIRGVASVTIRKDLVPQLQAIINALPSIPKQ